MRGRYGTWTPGSVICPPRGCSSFWRAICQAAPTIVDDIHCMIGDGTSVYVTQDSWVTDLPLVRWPTFISSDIDPTLQVSSLICQENAAWNAPLVFRLCGLELAHRILAMPLPRSAGPDTRLWRRSCLPCAPTRDLIARLRPSTSGLENTAWIWRLPVHPRIQLFLWKLWWNRLPTCSLLADRGLDLSPLCPICGMQVESVDHVIFLCSRASQIWQLTNFTPWLLEDGPIHLSFLHTIRLAIQSGLRSQGVLSAYLAYHIWLTRNQIVFAEETVQPQGVLRRACCQAREYYHSYSGCHTDAPGHWDSPAAMAAHRSTVFISWEPPPPGFIKVNFDGSVSDRCAGAGFVIRGPDGQLLAAGGHSAIDISVPMAELQAAWAGITYAIRQLGHSSLIIEGDSLSVIRWIRQEVDYYPPHNPLIRDILASLQSMSVVVIRHIYREANAAADWVASFVASHSGQWEWHAGAPYPVIFQQILCSDISGLTRARMV